MPVVVDPSRLFTEYRYVSGTSPVFRRHLQDQAFTIRPPQPGFVVEIGSNDGTLLHEFQQLGHRVLGVDPAQNLAAKANEQGLPTLAEFFDAPLAERILRDHGAADLVVANNVFAHADDLEGIARGVERLLSGNGRFVFEVGYLPAVLANRYFDTVYHEHLSYHHLRPLVPFFERLGLALYDAEEVDSQGGSVRCHVMREGGFGRTARLEEMLEEEHHVADSVAGLPDLVRDVAEAYKTQVAQFAAWDSHPRVAAFGAPAKCVTLMAALGMQPGGFATPEVIYEENPLKCGLCTPYPRIPIRPAHELLLKGDTDVCVIFAWNFQEDIRRRYKRFKGKWLVPLPEPVLL